MSRVDFYRLKEYAERNIGVDVYVLGEGLMSQVFPGAHGAFSLDDNAIYIMDGLSVERQVTVIAHEIGHAVDALSEPDKYEKGMMAHRYLRSAADYNLPIPEWVGDYLLELEDMAFILGESVLQGIGVIIPPGWQESREECLDAYHRTIFGNGDEGAALDLLESGDDAGEDIVVPGFEGLVLTPEQLELGKCRTRRK